MSSKPVVSEALGTAVESRRFGLVIGSAEGRAEAVGLRDGPSLVGESEQ
jgi:hypothetical protein